jgi:superfamily II DNA/RNA helicase
MHFKDIIDDERILQTLEKLGYQVPTPIQAEAIPQILKGGDLRAASQTGTGKTAAFLLPALMRLVKAEERKGPKVLVLVPTRELAIQLASECAKLGRGLGLVTVTLYGGVPYPVQNRQLAKHYDILVATPGRLMDLMEQRRVNLSNIEMFILDEADRMLDMGFIGPVEEIAEAMPEGRQTIMFSATFGKAVRKLSASLLTDPFEIATETANDNHKQIEQSFHRTDNLTEKHKLLDEILSAGDIEHGIIFSGTKMQTDQIADKLCERGIQAAALHGDMNQRQRTRTIEQFRAKRTQILVATDVAARGIDILTVTHVINFDAPQCLDDYIHRIGRTGRAGNKGKAISFFSPKDQQVKREIEKFSGVKSAPDSRPPAPAPRGKASFRGGRPGGGGKGSYGRPFNKEGSGRPRFGQGEGSGRPKFGQGEGSDRPRRFGPGQGEGARSPRRFGPSEGADRPRRFGKSQGEGSGRPYGEFKGPKKPGGSTFWKPKKHFKASK